MIADTITKQIGEAMKARDEIRLSTLRMLSSALNYEKIAKQHDLSELEEIAVVRKEVKKRQDAIEALRQAQGKLTGHTEEEINEKIKKEENERSILKEYLPAEIEDSELEKVVDEAIASTGATVVSDMGKVIGVVMGKLAGKVDGSRVSLMVKNKLG